jgi:hypothetical protein
MSKKINLAITAAAMVGALSAAAVPMTVQAQSRFGSGVLNCDAPGGRQRVGAAIGAVLGGVVGSNVARNERTLGTVVGAGARAAAGSYIGCNQQRARANAQAAHAQANGYRATSNLRVRSGPGTSYSQVGSFGAGQTFQASGYEGEWIRLAGGGYVHSRYATSLR